MRQSISTFDEAVRYLENLSIMPKTMPGLQKIQKALQQTDWYEKIDPRKVIVVAGTNGKGSTCAALESLLVEAGQKVGFYSSPHLVSTVERLRINKESISEENFIKLLNQNLELIKACELSHFEALTLMAGHYYFSAEWKLNLDFVIFEVGLGGTYDATNAFPHKFNIITKLGLDHTNILGSTLAEVARNKFGIVTNKSIVVHHRLPDEVYSLKMQVQKQTNSNWIESEPVHLKIIKTKTAPKYILNHMGLEFETNLIGARAAENIMTAITAFQILGFDLNHHEQALNKIKWPGRMQKYPWPKLACDMYLSGDHNPQGVESLLKILKDFEWNTLHLVAGIGVDKDADEMLAQLTALKNLKLYLTETPFKGRKLEDYPEIYSRQAVLKDKDLKVLLDRIASDAEPNDLVLVTGSLYLVGEVLKIYKMDL